MDCLPMGKIGMPYTYYIHSFSYCINPSIYKEWAAQYLSNEVKKIKTPIDQTEVILSYWMESFMHIEDTIEIIKSYNFKKITILADLSQKSACDLIDGIDVIYLNIFPIILKNMQSQPRIEPQWNSYAAKGLFFAGAEIRRKNRIVLLKKLYDKQLLIDKIMWTCPYINNHTEELVNKFFPNINPEEFNNFINHCDKHAIIIPGWFVNTVTNKESDEYVSNQEADALGTLFKQTNFSVVAESEYDVPYDKSVFLTEKIYRAIYNKHPFILVAAPYGLATLKAMGFKTFENYLPKPEYDNILDSDLRLDAIVDNIVAFPDAITQYSSNINDDIEYNYTLINDIINRELTFFHNLCIEKNLPIDTFEFCFPIVWSDVKKQIAGVVEFNQQSQELIAERVAKNY